MDMDVGSAIASESADDGESYIKKHDGIGMEEWDDNDAAVARFSTVVQDAADAAAVAVAMPSPPYAVSWRCAKKLDD